MTLIRNGLIVATAIIAACTVKPAPARASSGTTKDKLVATGPARCSSEAAGPEAPRDTNRVIAGSTSSAAKEVGCGSRSDMGRLRRSAGVPSYRPRSGEVELWVEK